MEYAAADDVVRQLYDVFRPYRLGSFDPCTHCVSPEDHQRLASKSLASLAVSDVDRYARKAMTTWGTVSDFKHFLPRLLELALEGYLDFLMPEVLLGKLAYADWKSWPLVERQVVSRYLDTFWDHHLNQPLVGAGDDRIVTVLGGLAEACGAVSHFLAMWEAMPHETAALHLACFVDGVADEFVALGVVRLWSESDRVSTELGCWLETESPRQTLDRHRGLVQMTFPYVFSDLDAIHASAMRRRR